MSNNSFKFLLYLPRYHKQIIVLVLDVILSMFAVWLAFYLRIDQLGFPEYQQIFIYFLSPLLFVPIFIAAGLYRAFFRYTGMAAMLAIVKSMGAYAALFCITLTLLGWSGVPRSIGLIQPMIFLILVGGSRAFARFWLAHLSVKSQYPKGRLLIYGAGEAGVQSASALALNNRYVLLGYIDDDTSKVGGSINGVTISSPDDLDNTVERMSITDILLAIPSLDRAKRNQIVARLSRLPLHVRTLPNVGDLTSGIVSMQDFQELDVEDLLGRLPVPPDRTLLAQNIFGKTVLVSGAGGSIGSELCRQIMTEKPLQLILVEHSEFNLYSIHGELLQANRDFNFNINIIPLLANICNYDKLREIFLLYRPQTVYHAAAYKHVPLVESNQSEGIFNNVFGTLNMAQSAIESSVSNFVLISTDKAVRPTNVMGATKRISEMILQALASEAALQLSLLNQSKHNVNIEFENHTIFSMVRFGNVLGSSGSVFPLFRKQLQSGGPLTLTHLDVTRYFMTIPEAAQLVLQAGAMSSGGDVFVLNMGEPIKILDLARRMAQLSGVTLRDNEHPDGDIQMVVTGLRPGEKLHEELLIGNEPQTTEHMKIMKAQEEFLKWNKLTIELQKLHTAALQNDDRLIKKIFKTLVHGYSSSTIS